MKIFRTQPNTLCVLEINKLDGKNVKKEYLLIAGAQILIGDLLTIIGVFLRWGRLSRISGWDIITTYPYLVYGKPSIFLVLIGGIIAFFGGLALISALIGNWALSVKRGITYLLWLGLLIAAAGCMWNSLYYGGLPFGLFVSWLGNCIALIGLAIIEFGLFLLKIKNEEG